jgi:Methane oxygenase PmoA
VIIKLLALGLLSTGLAFAAPAGGGASTGASGFTFAVHRDQGLLELGYNERPILVYAFATNQFKPFVRALYTLQGDNVLLDAPPDHLHHHGLMYAIRVNGINFWEERDQPGYERPIRLLLPQTGRSSSGLPRAWFTQVIDWVSNKDATVADTSAVALLIERRTLTVTIDEKLGELALDWHAEFEVGRGAAKVTLAGANYNGLGLRLPEAFNRVAQHQNSENAPYVTNGKGDVSPAKWSSVSHSLDGRNITVALFGHPTTERGLPTFFTMVQPFTYLSVTQGLDKAPLEYSAGDKFSLDCRLVVYAEHKAPDFLQQRWSNWNQR